MSATNRGSERIESDNYPTPPWCVRRMLEAAPWNVSGWCWRESATYNYRILEPCAGEGAIVRELRSRYPSALIGAFDIRGEVRNEVHAAGADGFMTHDVREPLQRSERDLVLTNPPFSLWHEFAETSLKHSTWTALLLRIGAVAHLEGLPTPSLYILPDRPIFAHKVEVWRKGSKFADKLIPWNAPTPELQELLGPYTDDGKWELKRKAQSDASEYAWLVWGPQAPTVHILAKTPLSERKQLPVRLAA